MKTVLVAFALVLVALCGSAAAQTCEVDCNRRCCKSYNAGIFGKGRLCDPACKTSCESTKLVCRNTSGAIPTFAPPAILNEIESALNRACAVGFEAVTKYVIISQGAYPAGSNRLLDQAKQALIQSNTIPATAFNNVNIRWCKIRAAGMAPDRNQICISDTFLNDGELEEVAIVLAHEMHHIKQYRDLGTDNFKCRYTRAYIDCRGCQDVSHPLEKAAYDFEYSVARSIEDYVEENMDTGRSKKCSTPRGVCEYFVSGRPDTPCQCIMNNALVDGRIVP